MHPTDLARWREDHARSTSFFWRVEYHHQERVRLGYRGPEVIATKGPYYSKHNALRAAKELRRRGHTNVRVFTVREGKKR